MTTLGLTINGRAYGPMDVRDDLTLNDFLREHLGMTGTKFGCGAAQCLSCAVIVDNPDGTSYTSPTCIVPAASFNGKTIRTVEGHAKNGELHALQKAFVDHFAFQCGYCTAGFLNEGQVLLERLAKTARSARRSGENHRRGARRSPVPLHRLHQISRGRARRDSGRSGTLSRLEQVRDSGESTDHEDADRSGSSLPSQCMLRELCSQAMHVSETAPRTALRRPRALPRSATRRRARQRCSLNLARC